MSNEPYPFEDYPQDGEIQDLISTEWLIGIAAVAALLVGLFVWSCVA